MEAQSAYSRNLNDYNFEQRTNVYGIDSADDLNLIISNYPTSSPEYSNLRQKYPLSYFPNAEIKSVMWLINRHFRYKTTTTNRGGGQGKSHPSNIFLRESVKSSKMSSF